MSRVWALLVICLVAVSLFSASTTHARANLACANASAAAETGHLSGVDERVPSDQGGSEEKGGMPHHHAGCHGHQVAPQIAAALPLAGLDRGGRPLPANAYFLSAATADPALRPPQA